MFFSWVPSHWEVEKQVNSRDYITGQEFTEKTQVLVLTLYPSSDITQASACPLERTGQETGNHLAGRGNERDKKGHGHLRASGCSRKPLSRANCPSGALSPSQKFGFS